MTRFPIAFLLLPSLLPAAAPADSQAVLMLKGLPAAQAVAVNPQGSPMVASATHGGGVARVLGRSSSLLLAETSGLPVGLAFDASGDLYVADRRLCELFRVTPWGRVEIVSENFKSPEGVAVGPQGDIYVTDRAASRVYRVRPDGMRSVFTDGLARPTGIVASGDGRYVFVSDTGKIWRFGSDGAGRKEFATLAGDGQPAGLALDEKGNLYVARDGGGKVSVLSPDGQPVTEYSIPGPRVTGVAFGGYELNQMYVTEAEAGALYRLKVPHRSQRLLWEPGQALRITSPAGGAILNRHDGAVADGGLRIRVKGLAPNGAKVSVNGVAATAAAGEFEAQVVLRQRENRIEVKDANGRQDAITVLWDRDSFPRYRFSTDDNVWFLRDIARNASTYTSIFQNPYLALWRDMHRKYGTKVHHNIYYETAGFNLSQMPDKFRAEWQANADWMRLSFHARANDPARPYLHSSPEQIRQDYRAVVREIERFAGKEVLGPVTTIHWGATTQAAARALRQEGVRVLLGVDPFRDDLPHVGYYLSIPQMRYMLGRDYWKDTKEDILFLHHDIVVNGVTPDKIDAYLDRVAADSHESEVMELIIHEEYFDPEYRAYEPDFRQRVERAIQWVTRHGYKPVFFGDGFLGTGKN